MRQQCLIERASPADLVAGVDPLRGLHAQLMSSVDLALWARIDGLEREAVADAPWRKRTLVKIWAMRATLHLLPAADLGIWIAGLGIWKPGTWPLKDPEAIPLASYIDKALRGKILTRTELAAAVTKLGATPKMVESLLGSWGGSLKPASYFGYLCSAPNDGQQVRFTHPATWLRKPPIQPDSNKAFDVLTARYLGTCGPATAVDLGRWWGINQTQAKRRLAALGDVASEVTIEGEWYWMLAKDIAELAATEPVDVVRLLPAFDQWGSVCVPPGSGAGGSEVPASDLSTAGLGLPSTAREWPHGGRLETRAQRAEGICRDRTVREAPALDPYAHCGGSRTLGQLPGRRSGVEDSTLKA
jgi:hypothetical protein